MGRYLVIAEAKVAYSKVVEAESHEHAEELFRESLLEADGFDEEVKHGLMENIKEVLSDFDSEVEIYSSQSLEPGDALYDETDILPIEEADI